VSPESSHRGESAGMNKTLILKRFASGILLGALMLGMGLGSAFADTHSKKQKKQAQPPPPLPSGPTGKRLPQVPLDAIKPVAPQVSFQSGQLTIVAPNSTLGDILRAVRKQTGAEIDIPEAQDRVVTNLGPGPAREVVAELLNGSRFNYVLLGSPQDANVLTRVVLVAKSGPDNPAPNNPAPNPTQQQAIAPVGNNMAPPPAEAQEANDADQPDDSANADENADAQPAAEEQPVPDQSGAKTPQQMLQEMQQRQMQMQQQLAPGQPPIPGGGFAPGMPPRPPQQPEQQQ
jgi:hypothetical protein